MLYIILVSNSGIQHFWGFSSKFGVLFLFGLKMHQIVPICAIVPHRSFQQLSFLSLIKLHTLPGYIVVNIHHNRAPSMTGPWFVARCSGCKGQSHTEIEVKGNIKRVAVTWATLLLHWPGVIIILCLPPTCGRETSPFAWVFCWNSHLFTPCVHN